MRESSAKTADRRQSMHLDQRGRSESGIGAKIRNNRNKVMLFLLAAILVYALVYQLRFIEGPSYFGDDTTYTYYANQVLHGTFAENTDVFSLRLLSIYPVALFYLLFGVGKLSTAGWAIATFLGSIAVAFYIGKEIYNDYVGVLSALFMSFFPLLVILSGTPSPDIPEAFFIGLAILALILGQKRNSRAWFFVGGVAIIASFLATPSSAYLFVAIFLYLIIELARKKLKIDGTSLHFIYGLIIAGILLLAYNYLTTGNALITITTTTSVYSTVGTPVEGVLINTDLHYYFNEIFSYHIIAVLKSALANHNFGIRYLWQHIYVVNYNEEGFFFYAAVVCAAYLLLVREKRAYIPLLWLTVGFLALEFGPIYVSLVPFKYVLTNRLTRYLTVIIIPTVMITAMALVNICERAHKSGKDYLMVFPVLLALFLIATAIPIIQYWHMIVYYLTYDQTAIANYLNMLPNNTKIYLESGFLIDVYMHYNNMSRFFVYDQISNCTSIPPGSYVALPKYITAFNLSYTPDPSKYCPSWKLVLYPKINGSYPQYVTGPAEPFYAKLYYVPKPRTG